MGTVQGCDRPGPVRVRTWNQSRCVQKVCRGQKGDVWPVPVVRGRRFEWEDRGGRKGQRGSAAVLLLESGSSHQSKVAGQVGIGLPDCTLGTPGTLHTPAQTSPLLAGRKTSTMQSV